MGPVPICYASSGPSRPHYRSLDQIQQLIDTVVQNEGEPDVVQISGGEPTLHPEFFAILDRAKAAPIRHLMVNTNGIRIAQDEEFAQRLADYMPHFEVYLQFDSFEREALEVLRGRICVRFTRVRLTGSTGWGYRRRWSSP